MLNAIDSWLEDRTGFRSQLSRTLEEPIPGGARLRYVFGSAVAGAFALQIVTGVLLMTAYSPSSSTAWGSVFYINHVMWMGWFIRGLHHFSANALPVLVLLHLVQVVLAGAYRRPREVNWWFGVALFVLIMAFGHTGYQLPWDQKGYWSTKVVTNIIGGAPVVGPYIKTLVVGGPEYGNVTLTRFYGIHVAILPILTAFCLYVHVALCRRHGLTTPAASETQPRGSYWPEQAFRNTAFFAFVLAILVGLNVYFGGAPLDAPADPSSPDYPARPEWFFLSLFQMLKRFPGRLEWVGSIVVPSAILLIYAALPILDRLLPSRLVHFLACAFTFALIGSAGYLITEALQGDARDKGYQEARAKADLATDRALFLAASPAFGVPPEGAGFLLRRDPLSQGKLVLGDKCLGCHYLDGKGTGSQTAADLKDFGSRAWIRGLLENPQSPTYFGKVPQCDGMAEWKKGTKLKAPELDKVADFVASFAKIPADITPTEWLNEKKVSEHPGYELFQKDCGTCHKIEGYTEGGQRDSPELFAWGSPQWIARMTRKPHAPDLYGYLEEKDRMPSFDRGRITQSDLEMVVKFLTHDYLRPGESSHAAGPTSPASRHAEPPKLAPTPASEIPPAPEPRPAG